MSCCSDCRSRRSVILRRLSKFGGGLSTRIMPVSFFFLSYKLAPEYQREEEKRIKLVTNSLLQHALPETMFLLFGEKQSMHE